MRHLIVLSVAAVAVAVALATSATAVAGGWATVGLSSLPDGIDSGDPWKTEITVLQHGRTPLDGLEPSLTISGDRGTHTFTASPAGEPGVYEASVVFPEPGRWTVVVDSGFGESRLTYGPVTIGPGVAGAPGSFPVLPVAVAVAAGLALLGAGLFGLRRVRRLAPAGQ